MRLCTCAVGAVTALALALCLAVTGCDDEDEWVPPVDNPAIEDSSDAGSAVRDVYSLAVDAALNALDPPPENGTVTYNSEVVHGTTGTATVSGTATRSHSESPDRVSSSGTTDVQITFANYKATHANPQSFSPDTIAITGSVDFYVHASSVQTGDYYSGDSSATMSGNVTLDVTDTGNTRHYTTDTMTFSASGASMDGVLSGTVTAANGTFQL